MKEFMIVAPITAFGYQCVFPSIKEGKIWIPEERPLSPSTGKEYGLLSYHFFYLTNNGGLEDKGGTWLFSIPQLKKHHLELTKTYTADKYPLLDNYDAIEVSRIKDIPKDYTGVMAVPINFLLIYNPEEWEIIQKVSDARLNGKNLFYRLLIKKK